MQKPYCPVASLLAGLVLAAGCCASIAQAPAVSSTPSSTTLPTSPSVPTATKPQPNGADPATNPKYTAAMADATKMEHDRQYLFAMDDYKKANKIAGGRDRASLNKLFDLQMKTGSFKDAIASAATLETTALSPVEKSNAESGHGRAIFGEMGDKNKGDKLKAADAAFEAAISDDPKNITALYMDGLVLARLNQMEAASERFKQCLSCIGPNDPVATRARHFAGNPALSTAKMAPPFTVVTLDGSKFNLDEMGGRVVLIDFWATWCGPCNEELPHMQKIAREFAGQPLVIISVSWDNDEAKWKEFINKHEMTWMQYRDADHELSKRFDVNAIPHYFTIDADGVLTAEMMGSGSDVEGKLKKLIAKAKAAKPASVSTVTGQ